MDNSSLLALLVYAKTICIMCIIARRYNNIGLINCVGGVSGALGRITGALAKTTTKLTLDKEFQEERKRAGAKGIGQGLEGAAKVDLYSHCNCFQRFMCIFCNLYMLRVYGQG